MHYSSVPMHILGGGRSVAVAIALWVVSAVVVAYALRRVNRDLGERQVPMMGVLAACIFAGQMLNFAVAGGTSGHLMGAAIAAILLGPWAAVLVLTCVVGVQALIFQDGGLLSLGGNIFNMGIVGVFVAYAVYSTVRRIAGERSWGIYAGGFLAAWTSVFVAALGVALQLALSNTSPANIAIPTMGGIHALIGIGEGLITVGALAFLRATRRDLVEAGAQSSQPAAGVWVSGLLIAVTLAIASPLASSHPDGLEWVAEQQGFLSRAQGPAFTIIPEYVVPGISNEALATIAAGVLGAFIVAGLAAVMAYARRKRGEAV